MKTRATAAITLLLITALGACSDSPYPLGPSAADLAKGGVKGGGGGGGGESTDVRVDSVDPPYGEQGETLDVVIHGSGFDDTSEATRELDGVPAARIRTNATVFRSSSELVANISIQSDAELDFYDVAVSTQGGRKKGIGIEKFEVTTAIALVTIDGNSAAHAVNERGQAAGFSNTTSGMRAVYWHFPTSIVDLGPGHAWDMDEAGSLIVGMADGRPVYWTGSGQSWTGSHALPMDEGTIAGRGFAVASDPATGVAMAIGGSQAFRLKGQEQRHEPLLWVRGGQGWEAVRLAQPLPDPNASSWANDVNSQRQAVGAVDLGRNPRRPVYWDSDGNGRLLSELGGTAQGISEDGSFLVGDIEFRAVYWTRDAAGSWIPHYLPGNCQRAYAVDASRRIVATRCGENNPRQYSALFVPGPGGTYTQIPLGGFGDSTNSGQVEGLSRSGSYASGGAPAQTVTLGAIWALSLLQ